MGRPVYCWEVVCGRCRQFMGMARNSTEEQTFLCRKCVQTLIYKGEEAEESES